MIGATPPTRHIRKSTRFDVVYTTMELGVEKTKMNRKNGNSKMKMKKYRETNNNIEEREMLPSQRLKDWCTH